jgi:hypothetical protein
MAVIAYGLRRCTAGLRTLTALLGVADPFRQVEDKLK